MKDRKRLIVYSALALPFVVFAGFMATQDPIARRGFLAEFKGNIMQLFGGGDDTPAPAPADAQPTGSLEGDRNTRGGGGGRRDPAQMFARLDVDNDGKLTGDEISEWMRPALAEIDTDEDDALTLEEMQNGMEQIRANRPSRGEGRERRGRGGDTGGRFDPEEMFSRRDTDSDGKLAGDEIDDRMRRNLDQIDTDQDGSVSLEEFQERMRTMMANFGGGGDSREDKPERPQRPE